MEHLASPSEPGEAFGIKFALLQQSDDGLMNDTKSPDLMQMLAGHMRYMGARQKVLSRNIANIDTPNYQPHDLKKPNFSAMVTRASGASSASLATTSSKHFTGSASNNAAIFAMEEIRKTHEISPTGNGVVLEEQMAKISETGGQYEMASSLYRKFGQMMRAALGSR